MRGSWLVLLMSMGCWEGSPNGAVRGPLPDASQAPIAPEPPTCATDEDCVLFDKGRVCCGTLCGAEGGVSTRAYAKAYQQWEAEQCKDRTVNCPVARCASSPWDTAYRAVCVSGTCVAETSFKELPDKAALMHFCKHMTAGPTPAVEAALPEEKQHVWMAEMSDAASQAQLAGWTRFEEHLKRVPTSYKQDWLQAGVMGHGVQSECAVILALGSVK